MDDIQNRCISMLYGRVGAQKCRPEPSVIKARWNAGICPVWSRENYDGFPWDHIINQGIVLLSNYDRLNVDLRIHIYATLHVTLLLATIPIRILKTDFNFNNNQEEVFFLFYNNGLS